MKEVHGKLGQWMATAICGNDILSSTLYVAGIAVLFSGMYAPLVLLIIAVILYLYKSVYTEVVEALPINGGAYNCLLNSTNKTIAAVAGVTTILSYIATSVLSAKVGVEYLHTLLPVPVIPVTILLLLVFAVMMLLGIKDSAKVAAAIFFFNLATLSMFVIFGIIHIFTGPNYFLSNLNHTTDIFLNNGGIWKALFFGFSASLLGVSGFESSANFVEEQQRGVFRKTLRNMLVGVAIFSPLIAFIVLNSAPFEVIVNAKEFLLADQARIIGGSIFGHLVAIDAFLVLSGAVLTSFVGVGGLVFRMASDGCLPKFLTIPNRNGVHARIVILFFLLCTSILLITRGNLLSLAGVYTISFLGVMSLFAIGNLILRENRPFLKRTYIAPLIFVVVAFAATAIGIVGNILIDPFNLLYFALYFIPAVVLVLSIVYKDLLIGFMVRFSKPIQPLHRYFSDYFNAITSGTVLVFVNHVNRLHEILGYINKNEIARNIVLVHCRNHDDSPDWERHSEINTTIPYLKKAGVFPHLNIELVYETMPFGPEAIEEVSKKYSVSKNNIFIGSIHNFHKFDYDSLGGVRIIF